MHVEIFNFIVSQILREPSLFLGLVALAGLLLQRKALTEVINGTVKTVVGVLILTEGAKIIIGAISPLTQGFNAINGITPAATILSTDQDVLGTYGSFIGISMLLAFAINLLVARFTPLKNIFLTGHILFWVPFVLIGVALRAGLHGMQILIFSTLLTSLYIVIMPALARPLVRKVTNGDTFTLGHPTITLSLIAAAVAKMTGNRANSTENLKLPQGLAFLREIMIVSSLFVFIIYLVVVFFVDAQQFASVFKTSQNRVIFSLLNGMKFGAGLTIMLQGVRMMLAEIIPSFKGISDKLIPNAIPALDCPIIFPFAPNAVLIGFIVSVVTSTLTLLVVNHFGWFNDVILPMTITCFFEIGAAAVIANAYGGVRGTIIGSGVAGIVMILFVGASLQFVVDNVAGWMTIFGGNDFSLLAIFGGLLSHITTLLH